ncbi:MAG: alpha/beta fold hydrolase, partial [Acidimicrobiales bacterium]|nr:alpha/beta fold hydrolase [Acidimicrobiales bacterium]
MRTVEIEAADGLRLTADEWGDPSNPAVLMCHGAGQNRYAWKTSAEILSQLGWFVVTIDARGHGDSDWSSDHKYDAEDIGRDVVAVLDRFHSPPAVVGASMGGMASLAAQRVSEHQLFAALVLVDITPHFDMEGARKIIGFMSGNPDGFVSLDEAADVISAYNPHRARPTDPSGLSRVLQQRSDGRWIWKWDPAYVT